MWMEQKAAVLPNTSEVWSPLFDQLSDIVLLLDQQGMIVQANLAWHRVVSRALPVSVLDWIYPDDQIKLQQSLFHTQPQQLRLRIVRPKFPLAWFDCSVQLVQQQSFPHLYCLIGRNITHSLTEQRRQQAQQRSLEELIQRLPVMIYRSRNDWHWTMDYVSEGCEALTGFTRHELLNTPLYGQLIYADDQHYVWEEIQFALQQHSRFQLHYRLINKAQQVFEVREVGQGLYSESGMVLGVAGVVMQSSPDVIEHRL